MIKPHKMIVFAYIQLRVLKNFKQEAIKTMDLMQETQQSLVICPLYTSLLCLCPLMELFEGEP